MADPKTAPAPKAAGKTRSPNYPAMSLEEALQRLRVIYDKQRRYPTTRDVLAKLLGYGGVNGASATVLSALGKYGLQTERAAHRRTTRAQLENSVEGDATAVCPRHGATRFRRRSEGGWRCLKCRAEAVVERRRVVKATLVREAGGACALCGYDRSMVALQFHHRDPADKQFHIAHRGAARSISTARGEAAKCVLLCANCHAEVEAGLATIPAVASDESPG
jgi:ribosomal protein L37AE/L43A